MKSIKEQYKLYNNLFAFMIVASIIMFALSLVAPFILHLPFHTEMITMFVIAIIITTYFGILEHKYKKLLPPDPTIPTGSDIIHVAINQDIIVLITRDGTILSKRPGTHSTWFKEPPIDFQ